MIELSFGAIQAVKFFLTYTGEKEINEQGKDIFSARKLNGEDVAQRRHFMKAVETIIKEQETVSNELRKEHNEKVEKAKEEAKKNNPKLESESQEKYDERINLELNKNVELLESVKNVNEKVFEQFHKKHKVEITDKTKSFVQRMLKEFGEKAGFTEADDDYVCELEEALK